MDNHLFHDRIVDFQSKKKGIGKLVSLVYQSQVSILGPVGYGPTTLPLRHSDVAALSSDNLFQLFIESVFHCPNILLLPRKEGRWEDLRRRKDWQSPQRRQEKKTKGGLMMERKYKAKA
jgi:hypothetical protein